MVVFPNAKINIGLQVTGKRPDGFHSIESIFYPIPLRDALEMIPSESFSFITRGDKIDGTTSNNLVKKAYDLLNSEFSLPPVSIALLKKIPMGAGLGGGSSDGAFTITLFNEVFQLNLSVSEMEVLAAKIGSDCPFFIKNKAAYVSGRGESLQEVNLNLKGYYLAITNPGIHISTAEAFKDINPAPQDINLREYVRRPLEDWKNAITNQFEKTVFPIHHSLAHLKGLLYNQGAIYASMTGSGSSIYGIFREQPNLIFPDNLDLRILKL